MTTTRFRDHLLRKMHFQTLVQAVALVHGALDDPRVLACASRFFRVPVLSGRELEKLVVSHDCETQFVPWLLWDAEMPDGPLGAGLGRQLQDKRQREILRALMQTAPDVWQFSSIGSKSVQLRRLRDDRRAELTDPVLRQGPQPGDLIIGRVVDVGDTQLLDAVHESLPASCERAMRTAAIRIALLPVEARLWQLRRAAVLALTDATRAPPRRSLLQGELSRTTLVFEVPKDQDVLALLDRVATTNEVIWVGPRRFVVSPGQPAPAGAVLRLVKGRLHASTIRADKVAALQALVQAAVPAARLQLVLHRNLRDLFDPALRARLGKTELHTLASDWLSEQLALKGDARLIGSPSQTLREATASRSGKLRVRAWLRRLAPVAQWAEPGYQLALQALTQELFGA